MKKQIITNAEELKSETAPLYHQYQIQCQPQSAYVEIYPGEKIRIIADWNGEIGNGMPMDLWHHRYVRLEVSNCAYGPDLAELLESTEFLALASRIDTGFEEEWDGSNWVGRYTADSEAAIESAQEKLNNEVFEAEVWDTEEWLFANCSLREHWDTQSINKAVKDLDDCVDNNKHLNGDIEEALIKQAKLHVEYEEWDNLTETHINELLKRDKITTEDAADWKANQ